MSLIVKDGADIIFKSKQPDIEVPKSTVGDLVNEALLRNNDKVLFVDAHSGKSITSAELLSCSMSMAKSLVLRGLTKEDKFAIFSHSCIEFIVAQICVTLLGNTFTAVKHHSKAFELGRQLEDCGAKFIFTSIGNTSLVQEYIQNSTWKGLIVITLDGKIGDFTTITDLIEEGKSEPAFPQVPYFELDPMEDIFCLVYTSGTTGPPKGVLITHYSILAAITSNTSVNIIGSKSSPIVSCHYPFGHLSGNFMINGIVMNGYFGIIHNAFTPESLLESVQKYKISSLGVYPDFGTILLNDSLVSKYDLSSLKEFNTTGAFFPPNIAHQLIEKYKVKFTVAYGLTEGGIAAFNSTNNLFPIGNTGGVGPNVMIKIIDLDTEKSVGSGLRGKICIKSPAVVKGYYNNHEATSRAFLEGKWFRTGDIGMFDEEGRLFVVDRIKEIIKYKQLTVYPAEIELFLQTLDSVLEAAVIGVKHESDGERPRAYIVKRSGREEVTGEDIAKEVAAKMHHRSQLTGGVVFVENIFRSSIGKVDRQKYKKMISDGENNINHTL